MTYLEFLKEFEMRMIVYSVGAKEHNWTPRGNNDWDICGLGSGNNGKINSKTTKNEPYNINRRIKTSNTKLIEIFSSNKIKDYIDMQPIRTKSLNTQSLQNILWILYTNK